MHNLKENDLDAVHCCQLTTLTVQRNEDLETALLCTQARTNMQSFALEITDNRIVQKERGAYIQ